MICPELFKQGTAVKQVKLWKYYELGAHRIGLVQNWYKRSKKLAGISKQKDFEPFIFAWFAFNAWGMCVTEADNDAEMIKSLALCPDINQKFNDLIVEQNSELAKVATNFINLLPIFDMKDLENKQLMRLDDQKRRERVLFYLGNGATEFDPRCWARHLNEEHNGQSLPVDWAHILKAIYKIRCNLFHGHKSAQVEINKELVSSAYSTLFQFVEDCNYFR